MRDENWFSSSLGQDKIDLDQLLTSIHQPGHALHLYGPSADRYAIHEAFLNSAHGESDALYIADIGSNTASALQKTHPELEIVPAKEVKACLTRSINGLSILMDGSSMLSANAELFDQGEGDMPFIEGRLEKLSRTNRILCTYDVTSTPSDLLKQVVECHDKLILTNEDVTMLSSPALSDLQAADDGILERFVKNYLDMLVLTLVMKKPMCGTEIMKTIHRNFNVLVSPGTIYPLLHQLEDEGLLRCEYGMKKKVYRHVSSRRDQILDMISDHLQINSVLGTMLSQTKERTAEQEVYD